MQDAVLIRLRPTSPWRFGPGDVGGSNALTRLDTLYRSDRLFSALTLAARQLGWLDEWLEATALSANPAVAFTSLFPYQGDTLFAPPPSTLWPPPASLVTTPNPVFLSKIRWNAARFVPVGMIESILMGQPILADQWLPDAESGCLLRRDRPSSSPFRTARRTTAAVDRINHVTAGSMSSLCVEFEQGAGLWTLARYANPAARDSWDTRIQSAFRLLSDTGFGARRTSGWGQAAAPEFQHGSWPALLMPKLARQNGRPSSNGNGEGETSLYWILSLYSPSASDAIDWTAGDYKLLVRGGHIEGAAASNAVKKSVRMIAEGSVLAGHAEPVGAAPDVAPEGFAHRVFRSGLAVALKLPAIGSALEGPVETPADKEALQTEERPCEEPTPAAETGPAEPVLEERKPAVEEIESKTPEPTTEEPASDEI